MRADKAKGENYIYIGAIAMWGLLFLVIAIAYLLDVDPENITPQIKFSNKITSSVVAVGAFIVSLSELAKKICSNRQKIRNESERWERRAENIKYVEMVIILLLLLYWILCLFIRKGYYLLQEGLDFFSMVSFAFFFINLAIDAWEKER